MEIYLIGGAVRDTLLGKEPKDKDYCVVDSTHEQMKNLGYKKVGAHFPVYLHPKTNEEYALARTEKSTGLGHNDFEYKTEGITLEQDCARRDFTINAIAQDEIGNIIDPLNGCLDLKYKVLRHCNDLSFEDDPVRLFRLARFKARFPDFTIYHTTLSLAKDISDNIARNYKSLTMDRVRIETDKALMSIKPSEYFRTLLSINENLFQLMYPELWCMTVSEHKSKFHLEGSVFEHTMMAIDIARDNNADLEEMYMTLYHDIGKPKCLKWNDEKQKNSFNGHESYELVLPIVTEMQHRYHWSNILTNAVINSATWHSFIFRVDDMEMNAKTIVKKVQHKSFPNCRVQLKRLFNVANYDSQGRITNENKDLKIMKYYINEFIAIIIEVQRCKLSSTFLEDYKAKFDKPASVEVIKQELHKNRIHIMDSFLKRIEKVQNDSKTN